MLPPRSLVVVVSLETLLAPGSPSSPAALPEPIVFTPSKLGPAVRAEFVGEEVQAASETQPSTASIL